MASGGFGGKGATAAQATAITANTAAAAAAQSDVDALAPITDQMSNDPDGTVHFTGNVTANGDITPGVTP